LWTVVCSIEDGGKEWVIYQGNMMLRYNIMGKIIISLLHVVQTDSEAHTTSYQIGIEGSLPRSKAAGA
jgi:hypothetical protein